MHNVNLRRRHYQASAWTFYPYGLFITAAVWFFLCENSVKSILFFSTGTKPVVNLVIGLLYPCICGAMCPCMHPCVCPSGYISQKLSYDVVLMSIVSICWYCPVSVMYRQNCLFPKKGFHFIRIGQQQIYIVPFYPFSNITEVWWFIGNSG